ncbi:flagellar brake domain-containing protein [Brevibacillus laterosporus]|uniref:flagellar brake protein n=1 Tax=Brevibacillus laterosporus TaxID=1465 RepID=UPI000CE48809|nr:flagellar brake domain-containing protein [Brevibacillus laterosporus]MBG9771930.1 glycosyltransferase [Brevibacillus laterosporus]MBG9797455.1 glycosyltransferase [Brevibacillus laterosporus]MCR8936201.1 flagellar brake domain-containing protein [Brevibacillus laterosporus]MCZ0838840.1 flagellar brake domain-containing protein [Brevibacillus laterosporus]MCZ0844870.1 flagellar brake domain-containing protein [Brevibacillus laterosporus]
MSVLPQVGQVMRLSLASLSEEQSKKVYKTRVADYSEKNFAIELPIDEETGRTESLPIGTTCSVWYVGQDGSRFDFETKIIGTKQENISMLLMEKVAKEQIIRTQRRGYLRVPASFEISVSYPDIRGKQKILAKTLDISGGGLAFACPKNHILQEEQEIDMWISFPSKTGTVSHAFAKAQVTRVQEQELSDFNWISLQFTTISEADRAKIVRVCYERQLEIRQKGIVE